MRIMRGLSSRVLPCGCLAGVYETYDADVVGIVDARGPICAAPTHEPGRVVPLDGGEQSSGSAEAQEEQMGSV